MLHSRTEQFEHHVQQNRQLTNSLAAAEHRLAALQEQRHAIQLDFDRAVNEARARELELGSQAASAKTREILLQRELDSLRKAAAESASQALQAEARGKKLEETLRARLESLQAEHAALHVRLAMSEHKAGELRGQNDWTASSSGTARHGAEEPRIALAQLAEQLAEARAQLAQARESSQLATADAQAAAQELEAVRRERRELSMRVDALELDAANGAAQRLRDDDALSKLRSELRACASSEQRYRERCEELERRWSGQVGSDSPQHVEALQQQLRATNAAADAAQQLVLQKDLALRALSKEAELRVCARPPPTTRAPPTACVRLTRPAACLRSPQGRCIERVARARGSLVRVAMAIALAACRGRVASHRIAASACARDSFACAQAHELHAKYEYEAEKAQGLEMQQVKSHAMDPSRCAEPRCASCRLSAAPAPCPVRDASCRPLRCGKRCAHHAQRGHNAVTTRTLAATTAL